MYDFEEYLHLALHASRNREPRACLGYLKEALRIEPDNAQALYLLAIQHAELGLHDHGIAGLTRVLALDAGLDIARLQLGLLLLDRERLAEAGKQFLTLRASTDQVLSTVASALVAGLSGQLDAACAAMRAGLAQTAENHGLRPLMQEALGRLERAKEASVTSAATSGEPQDNRIFMGAYDPATARR
jgi:tetratricopeptide (TPR) repeat protein